MIGFGENIRLALAGLRANKMRSLLTLLGIIIGISSVIVIMTVSAGITNAVTETFTGTGATDIQFYVDTKENIETLQQAMQTAPGAVEDRYIEGSTEDGDEDVEAQDEDNYVDPWSTADVSDFFTPDFEAELRERFADQIEAIGMQFGMDTGMVAGQRGMVDTSMGFTTEDFELTRSEKILLRAGRSFNAEEISEAATVAVVNTAFATAAFGADVTPQSLLGQSFDIETTIGAELSVEIVGVYEEEQAQGIAAAIMGDTDPYPQIFVPYSLAQELVGDEYELSTSLMVVRPAATGNLTQFKAELQAFLDQKWADSLFGVTSQDQDMIMKGIEEVFGMVSIGLSVIAGLSLLVGGIGVMNIMLVTVTERTREIGVRKALGATRSSIRRQFLVEAMIICLLGGLLGVLLGGLLGGGATMVLSITALPPLGAVVFSLLFSIGIGIFFGYYPASKAAKLNPIDALRYE